MRESNCFAQERKALEEGLSREIDQSNKGYQLLSRMGFKCVALRDPRHLAHPTQAWNGPRQRGRWHQGSASSADQGEYVPRGAYPTRPLLAERRPDRSGL